MTYSGSQLTSMDVPLLGVNIDHVATLRNARGGRFPDPVAAARVAAMRLRLLQDVLRRSLTDRHGTTFWLNHRDPMRLFADRPYLDDAIDRLFAG